MTTFGRDSPCLLCEVVSDYVPDGLDQYSRKVQRHGRIAGDQQERPGTSVLPVTWAEQGKRGSDMFLRIRRLGVRVPPSAHADSLVAALPRRRYAAGVQRRPCNCPYSYRDASQL